MQANVFRYDIVREPFHIKSIFTNKVFHKQAFCCMYVGLFGVGTAVKYRRHVYLCWVRVHVLGVHGEIGYPEIASRGVTLILLEFLLPTTMLRVR